MSSIDLAELQKIGGFVPPEPVAQEVTWVPPEGEAVTFTVHVLRLSSGAIERLWLDGKDRSHSAALIAAAVRLGEGGSQSLSYEQAFRLDPELAKVLLDAIDLVNPRKPRTVAAAKN